MKKIIALLLAIVTCLSFVACDSIKKVVNKDSEKDPIIGEWKVLGYEVSIIFNEDGTGSAVNKDESYEGEDTIETRWKYDEELLCYTVNLISEYESGIFSFTIQKSENGARYIDLGSGGEAIFYHIDDYDKAVEFEISKAIEQINKKLENRTKIEMNKSYYYSDGLSIKFTGITIDDTDLYLNVQFTNSSSDTLELEDFDYDICYIEGANSQNDYDHTHWVKGIYNLHVDEILANETIDVKTKLNASYLTNGKYTACYYMSFWTNEGAFYIDLVEWAK